MNSITISEFCLIKKVLNILKIELHLNEYYVKNIQISRMKRIYSFVVFAYEELILYSNY